MTEDKPLNATHELSLAQKILLFLNVNAFHLSRITTPNTVYRANYHSRGFAIILLSGIECAIGRYLFNLHGVYIYRILFFGFFIHLVIDLIFIKTIILMAGNYQAYYPKWLFYLFVLLAIFAAVCVVILLNSEIGHLPADYNKHH